MMRSILGLFWLAVGATVAAQPAAQPSSWSVPRTSTGQPDFEGIWNFAMLTPLERPREFAGREFLTDAEVADLERRAVEREDGRPPHDPQTDPSVHPAWWLDYGKTVGSARRTSLIVDPPDGLVPPPTVDALRRQAARAEARKRRGPADGPEDRNLFERCITRGWPVTMLPGPYNNHVQFVQTRDHVLIVTEMIHDARIVPLEPSGPIRASRTVAPTRPVRSWLGESSGRWEGDTLVVETTHFDERWVYRGSGPNLRLVERFTRTGPATIDYRVTMHDPDSWHVPWTIALPLTKTDALMYEYACHEGNYGLENILRGARATERSQQK
jgi:hypothetical protein